MSLQFICGTAGSGKTEYVHRYFLTNAPKDFKKNWFLIVPEQENLSTQQKIVSHPANQGKGILNIDVLSFDRLAYRVFEELSLPKMTIMDDMGKVMVLRAVAEKVKKNLILYKRQLSSPGFLDILKSQISEFYQYSIMPEHLDLAAEAADSDYTRAKFHDMAILYEAFREYMVEHGYHTKEEVLDALEQHLPDSHLLDGAVVAFDGFTGFTPVQLRILREILPKADRTMITLDISSDEQPMLHQHAGVENLFYLSHQTVEQLTKLAKEQKVELLPDVDLNTYDSITGERRNERVASLPRFREAPAMEVIEKHIYRYHVIPEEDRTSTGGAIEIHEARDLRQEVSFIASEIERAVREDQLRYRDIGIILTNPENYRDIIYKIFSDAQIPYFFDNPVRLMDSPYAEVMRAALEAVDRGFTFDSVIRYLRALPRTEEEAGEIDLLDNYLRKTGIRGYKRFSTPWAALPSTEPGKKDTDEKQVDPKLQQLEVIRQKYIAPLLQLYDDTKERSCPVQTRVAGLRALLATLDARAAVEKLSEDIRAHGDQNRAEILARGLDTIDDVLDKCEELLGDSAVSRTEFRDILDAGLSEESVRVIPATLDQVEIGDLTRSRFDSPKRFFIAGLTADQVPKAEVDDKLLTDRDRALFTEKLSLEVAPDRTENALEQRFYIYMALLNASGKLYLSFPVKGRDGKGLKPSGVLKDIENMFADLKVTRFHTGDAEIYTERELLRYTAEGLSDIHEGRSRQSLDLENFGKAIALLLKNPETKKETESLLRAAREHYTETKLSKATARKLYGEVLSGSITRMETFGLCPYRYFLQYGLGLQERETYEVQAYDIGNLYHAALEHIFRTVSEDKASISDYPEEKLGQLIDGAVEEVSDNYQHGMMSESGRNLYLMHRLRRITGVTAQVLAEQLRRGDFHVAELEKEFTMVRDGIRLNGRIDRVDLLEEKDKVYVRIIDYKTGSSTVYDAGKIYDGVQLQLAIYLESVMRDMANKHHGKEIVPAAMFYYHIDDPVLLFDETKTETEYGRDRLVALKPSGLMNSDGNILKLMDHDFLKSSDILPVSVGKNGFKCKKGADVASTEQFRMLTNYADKKIRDFGDRIREGDITVSPIETGDHTLACTYCPYHSICSFDGTLDGYRYRPSTDLNQADIFQKMQEDTGNDQSGHEDK